MTEIAPSLIEAKRDWFVGTEADDDPFENESESLAALKKFRSEFFSRDSLLGSSSIGATLRGAKNIPADSTLAGPTNHLFDALAAAKTLTSQVAMHLQQDWRKKLFEQLDDLLDAEDWHDEDEVLQKSSFKTFLRLIVYANPDRRPGLGLSDSGNLIAAWTNVDARLTLEFKDMDIVRWVLSIKNEVEQTVERASGETTVSRLPEVLAPYNPGKWFSLGD